MLAFLRKVPSGPPRPWLISSSSRCLSSSTPRFNESKGSDSPKEVNSDSEFLKQSKEDLELIHNDGFRIKKGEDPRFVQFLAGAVTGDNDRYLDELRDMLEERCGVRVSESTIWRTLHRAGFRMKEVSRRFS